MSHAAAVDIAVLAVSAYTTHDLEAPMRLKTFAGHDTRKLDKAVNAFLEDESIEVVKLSYHSNTFSYVVFVEYEPR